MKKYTCPCCGYKTFDQAPGSYDICSICFWEDDNEQALHPKKRGANISLIDAQNNFEKYGACDEKSMEYVRRPNETDIKDPAWKKL